VAANLDLDEFMVFEMSEDRAREFFLGLFHKHLTTGAVDGHAVADLKVPQDPIRHGFSDRRAFDELVWGGRGGSTGRDQHRK
jgi:hypothetical protein